MTDTLSVSLRVGFSFAFVLVLMWSAARIFRGRLTARGAGLIEVVARQQVTRGASIALVRIADQAYVVGVTEHAITMLGEPIADLASLAVVPAPTAGVPGIGIPGTQAPSTSGTSATSATRLIAAPSPTNMQSPTTAAGALGGSILSPATWRQTIAALRDRTVRRR